MAPPQPFLVIIILISGGYCQTVGSTEENDYKSLIRAHSVIMFISTTILLSIAIFIAKFRRVIEKYIPKAKDLWFPLHRGIQLTVVLFVVIGFIIAICFVSYIDGTHFNSNHARIGLVIVMLIISQPIIAFFRPYAASMGESKSTKRIMWELIHKGLGYLVWILSFVNVHIGLKMKSPGIELKLYIAWMMLVVTSFICLCIYDYYLSKQKDKIQSIGVGLLDNDVGKIQKKLSESVELGHQNQTNTNDNDTEYKLLDNQPV